MIAATTFGLTSCSDSNGGDSPSGGDGEGITSYLSVDLSSVGTVPGMTGSKAFTRDASHTNPGTGTYEDGTADEGAIQNVRFYFFNADGSAYTLNNDATSNNGGVDPTTGTEGTNTPATISNFLDVDWNKVTPTTDDLTTVERRTGGILVINGTTQALPAKIAAVVNVDANAKAVLGSAELTETALYQKTRDLTQYTSSIDSKNYFIMSNSVYFAGTDQQPLWATTIDASCFQTSAALARQDYNPVKIYVERVAARVDVDIDQSNTSEWDKTNKAYKLTETASGKKDNGSTLSYVTVAADGTISTAEDKEIYVVVDGWGLADENNNAPVMKWLDKKDDYKSLASTGTKSLDIEPLSVAEYHRSFWETTNSYTPIRYTFNQYLGTNTTNATTTAGQETTYAPKDKTYATNNNAYNIGLGKSAYTFPNTPYDIAKGWNFNGRPSLYWNETNRRENVEDVAQQVPTKVLVVAHLAYKNGDNYERAEICTYRGQNYLKEEQVKLAILNNLKNSEAHNLYTVTTTAAGDEYNLIGVDDITFVQVGDPGSQESYKLKPVIKYDATKTYAHKTASDPNTYTNIAATGTKTIEQQLNDHLLAVAGDDITIYKSGNTYYYTTLQHLWMPEEITDQATQPDNAGAWGVVRNHLYKVTLKSFGGWGTPVYDPTKVIIPITPKEEKTYLGADINVLMWRVVNQTVDINGNPLQPTN